LHRWESAIDWDGALIDLHQAQPAQAQTPNISGKPNIKVRLKTRCTIMLTALKEPSGVEGQENPMDTRDRPQLIQTTSLNPLLLSGRVFPNL